MAYDSESDRVVLFGGRGPSITPNDETWAYDLDTNSWTQRNPATRPPARFGPAMVYVPGLDRILMFGGAVAAGVPLDDRSTWVYNLNADTWTRINPSVTPSPRVAPMAYDAGSGKVVLFGGGQFGVLSNETWVYDPQTSTWTKMNPATAPSPRQRHRMVYAGASDRIILFGGDTGTPNAETWTYDVDTDSWTKMNPATRPSPRQGHAMAYDEKSDRILLFSGDTGVQTDDTWAYNVGTNVWERLSPPLRPAGRVQHDMEYDKQSDRMVLFGGEWPFVLVGVGTLNDDTWASDLDANEWIHMDLAMRPSARAYHAMAYDSQSDRIVLFGGSTRGGVSSDETWAYDTNTNTWRIRSPSASPSARDSHAMAYDAESDRVILFGGFAGTGPNGETWAYDYNANAWVNRMPAAAPSSRYAARMVYHSPSDRIILFGGEPGVGFLGDTWSYDFNSNTWTPIATSGAPPPRGFHAMGYDAESNLIVMFGGNGAPIRGDTWTFHTGTATWTQVAPATSPTARGACGGIYDAGWDRFVIFGGTAGPTETWAFDANANSWSLVASLGPSARHEHAMAYDGESDRGVLFGGAWPVSLVSDPNMVRNRETWIGSRLLPWTMVDGPEPPVASFTFSPTTPIRGQTVTFDGSSSTDSDGSITSHGWTFGDGGSSTGATATHAYSAPGTYTATLTVRDDDVLTNATSRSVVIAPAPDTSPPAVAIASPADGAILPSTVVDVAGTASDDAGVAKVELSTDGTTWTLATGTTSWSGTATLLVGPNTITARSTDTSGNTATASVAVTVRPSGVSIDPLVLALVAVAAVGVAAAAVVVIRRRRKAP